jgi:transposase InsO family protein
MQRIQHAYYWVGMTNDIQAYLDTCVPCRKTALLIKSPIQKLQSLLVTEPFARVGIDLIGPLSMTAGGFVYIGVATDYLTKWVETRALTCKTAENVAAFIYQQIYMTHGCPLEILSDHGTEFCNQIFEQVCALMGIKHSWTAAYHPQTNGLTERVNQVLCAMLTKLVDAGRTNWDFLLPQITFAFRTSVHQSTGFTPFELIFGRKARLPLHVSSLSSVIKEPDNFPIWFESFLAGQARRHQKARAQILKAQERQQRNYNRRIRSKVVYNIGDLFLVTIFKKRKLTGRFQGPYRVTVVHGNGTADIAQEPGPALPKVTNPVNMQHLRPCKA